MEDSTNEPLFSTTDDEISDHKDDVNENNSSNFEIEENNEECKPASSELMEKEKEKATGQILTETTFSSSKEKAAPSSKKKFVHPQILKLIDEAEDRFLISCPSGDQVDGPTKKRCKDIATYVCLDDDHSMEKCINEGPSLTRKEIQRRILEAVELNSLKCLDALCELYETNPTLRARINPESATLEDVQLFHRRYGLSSWPLDERPKETALHVLASRIASIKAMEVLEKRSAFLNHFADVQDSHESTPLLIAIQNNNIEVVQRLLNTKPRVEKRNRNGESPIYVAALNDQVDVIRGIINIYSESEIKKIMKNIDDDGHSILYPASQSGKPEVLNLVMEKSYWMEFLEQEKKSKEWKTFVCNVCACGCKRLAEKIFKGDSGILEKKRGESFNALEEVVAPLALMSASKANQYEIVELILDAKPELALFTTCDENGKNVFHHAVRNPRVLKYLLDHFKKLSKDYEAINKMDKSGNTPIKLAAVGGLTESFERLLQYTTSEVSAHLIENDHIRVVEMVLLDLEKKDPEALANLLHGVHREHQPFLKAARKGNIDLMEFFLKRKETYPLQRNPKDQTALHCAVLSGKLDAVQYLLNKEDFLGMIDFTDEVNITAAGYATQTGRAKILRCLLDKNAKIKSDKKTARLNVLDSAYGYFKTGENSIREIIQFCTKDKKIRNLQELFEDSYFGPDCIMSKLIEETPNVAMDIFNLCVYQDTYFTHISYGETKAERRVSYKFFPFKTRNTGGKPAGGLQAIESMVNNNRDNCLGHPLVIRFLNEKMNSSSIKKWLLLNFLLYTTFLLTLTTYAGIQSDNIHNLKSPGMIALSLIISVISAFHFIKEIFQMVLSRWEYMKDFDNYIEWVMYICAVIYVLPGESKANMQIAAGAIAVFLSWINFSLFLRRFSLFGIYVIMVKRVFLTVCKVLPLVVLYIAAFSLSLSLLMPQDQGFNTIPISFLTTFVMMTGELDYRDTFLASGPLHVLQKIILVLFILIISIAIMNLFTGLAVDDTNEIMNRSKEEKRIAKATLVIALEKTLHNLPFFSSTEIKEYHKKDFPDKEEYSWLLRQWWKIYDGDEIEERLKAMADGKEEDYSKKLDSLKEEIKETKELVKKIEQRLKA